MILKAPILYCGIGFWMFTNRQIFENVVIPIAYSTETVRYGHSIISTFQKFYPGQPYLILMGFFVLAMIFDVITLERFLFKKETLANLKPKPNTCSYYSVISTPDRLFFKTEEDFLRKTYGIERTSKERVQKLIHAKEGKRQIIRLAFYDMLANQKYRNMFQYVSVLQGNKLHAVLEILGD